MNKVLWAALKRHGCMIVGFNLGYDLTRLTLDWKEGEWSLVMMQYADGNENCNYPRILITPIDSKKQIIKLWVPWKKNQHEWTDAGRRIHFLDLRTLLWALYNKSYSLRTACDNKRGPDRAFVGCARKGASAALRNLSDTTNQELSDPCGGVRPANGSFPAHVSY